ncbi:MAG: GNAT family N-acetyltransferase [Jatrophihabitantaceae bacterium]
MRVQPAVVRTDSRTAALVHEPWKLRVDAAELTVRPSSEHDLAGAAVMHHRCSARSLLGRYRLGGRPPAVLALDRQLRAPLSFVVSGPQARTIPAALVATAMVSTDPSHGSESAEIAVLVEDGWQRQGIGRELVRHLAGAAALAGYTELIAYPGPSRAAVQQLMITVGPTKMIDSDDGGHLHTALRPSAVEGLGPLRTGRFVWGVYDDGVGAIA